MAHVPLVVDVCVDEAIIDAFSINGVVFVEIELACEILVVVDG
jgi:hypothetical protein